MQRQTSDNTAPQESIPGMHGCAPWGVRPWAVPNTPVALTPQFNNQTYQPSMVRTDERTRSGEGGKVTVAMDSGARAKEQPEQEVLIHTHSTDRQGSRQDEGTARVISIVCRDVRVCIWRWRYLRGNRRWNHLGYRSSELDDQEIIRPRSSYSIKW